MEILGTQLILKAQRMVTQNRFKTGLDIAKYTAAIMRKDMAEYDANASKYTQSLGSGMVLLPNKI
jgi:isocitrate lyase